MKKSEPEHPFSVPSRQSPVALLLILIKLIRGSISQLWPFLLVALLNPRKNSLMLFALGIAAISTIGSMLSYFRFYFFVQGEELVLKKGILRRTRLNIPIDRIQSIQMEQNVIHTLFNVVSLTIDTAGSQTKEFSITALGREKAEALRKFLLEQKAHLGPAEETETPVLPTRRLLMHLSIPDLLKVGVSQNHLRTAGILIAIALGILDDLEEVIGQSLDEMIESVLGIEQSTLFTSLLIGGLFLLVVSFFASLVLTVLRHFNLRFYEASGGFKIDAGLFNRREQNAPLSKIQFLRWSSNPVSRVFHMYTLRLYQAGGRMGRRSSLQIPGSYESHIQAVREAYFPGAADLSDTVHQLSPFYQTRRFMLTGLLPGAILILLGFFYWEIGLYALVFLGYLPLAFWWSRLVYRSWQLHLNERGMLSVSGVIQRNFTSLQWHKVQSVTISQSLYQRRHQVGDLLLHTAAGATRIPYLPIDKAQQLRNYCLYFVENSRLPWM